MEQRKKRYDHYEKQERSSLYHNDALNEEKPFLLMTMTNELLMLARLSYTASVLSEVIHQLERCRCVRFVTPTVFHIRYLAELAQCGLSVPYNAVPQDVYPILLGKGSLSQEGEITIDVHSHDRVNAIAAFMKKQVPSASITQIALYNQLCYSKTTNDQPDMSFDQIQQMECNILFSKDRTRGRGIQTEEMSLEEAFYAWNQYNTLIFPEFMNKKVAPIDWIAMDNTREREAVLKLRMMMSFICAYIQA